MQDLGSMAQSVAAKLKERGETVSVTESSGGGLISAALLSIPGASAYFMGGGVIYTHEARRGLLGVPEEAMEWIAFEHRALRAPAGDPHERDSRHDVDRERDGRVGTCRQFLWRQAGTLLYRGGRTAETDDDARDRRRRPGGQHVGLRADGPRLPRTVHRRHGRLRTERSRGPVRRPVPRPHGPHVRGGHGGGRRLDTWFLGIWSHDDPGAIAQPGDAAAGSRRGRVDDGGRGRLAVVFPRGT